MRPLSQSLEDQILALASRDRITALPLAVGAPDGFDTSGVEILEKAVIHPAAGERIPKLRFPSDRIPGLILRLELSGRGHNPIVVWVTMKTLLTLTVSLSLLATGCQSISVGGVYAVRKAPGQYSTTGGMQAFQIEGRKSIGLKTEIGTRVRFSADDLEGRHGGPGSKTKQIDVLGTIRGYFAPPSATFRPYLEGSLGLGYGSREVSGFPTLEGMGLTYGVGLGTEIRLSESVSLQLGAEYSFAELQFSISEENGVDTAWASRNLLGVSAGMVFRF